MLAAPIVALLVTGLGMMAYITADASGVDVPAPGLVMAGSIGLMIIEAIAAVIGAFRYMMSQENFPLDANGRVALARGGRRQVGRCRSRQRQGGPFATARLRAASQPANAPLVRMPSPPQDAAVHPEIDVHHADALRVPESMVVDDPVEANMPT
jgi:hypothetical protein